MAFPAGANHLVCDFVARYYAEEMTLLFAPDDGLFEGGGAELEAAGEGRDELGAHLRLLAERRYVALAWAAPTVSPTVLHRAVAKDVVKLNAVRRRYRLARAAAPSAATIGRWLPAIRERHAGREGVGRDWEDRLPRT